MGVNIGLLTEYSKIYPELSETIEELSMGIPKGLIFKAATTFLAKQTMDYSSATLLEVADTWFRIENFSFKEDLIKRVEAFYRENEISELTMLSPISSLKLLQLGFTKVELQNLKDEKQIEIDLFKIYLLLNESFTFLHDISSEYIDLHYHDDVMGMLLLNMGFSTSDLTNYIYKREFFCQSVKSMFLADFIAKEKQLQPHVHLLYKKYAVKSMEEYLSRIYGYLTPIGKKLKEGKRGFMEYNIQNGDDKAFALKISLQEYSDEDDIDFKVVRACPLVKIDNNTYRLTHPLFITDKLYKGLYFDLSKINGGLNKSEKISEFRTFYTSNFSEKYLFYEVINYCLKKRYLQLTGEEIKSLGIEAAPDYYIRNGKHIVLIENKDVLIKAEVKETPLFEGIEAELKKKFLEKQNGKGVGIKQIIKNIERTLSLKNPFDTKYKPSNAVVYPILVVHDIVFDAPGLNTLFNTWFFQELNLLKQKGLLIDNVKPLIVLNIDTLIRVSQLLRTGQLTLFEMFEMYYKNLKLPKTKFKDEQEMENIVTNLYLPSTKIMENWLNDNYPILKENKIMEYAFNKMKGK